ncbi:hypothetical protein [uncultured Pontibacter sp.]|uniref:hypothetical protein n=1 Tax=uncultured Pontibacter sp. TaxID=453356 RepID=UPI00260C5EE8|nr:hypothetical protein [uncultured Pontibacter sp.]
MTTEFDLTRLGHFIKRQLYMNLNSLWISIVAVTGFLLAASVLLPYFKGASSVPILVNLFGIVFFVCGFILSSKVYTEMQSPQKSYMFLTLPVSTVEKLIGAWLISSPIYVVAIGICFSILMAISALIIGEPVFSFFQSKYLFLNIRDISAYMVLQTIFLLGACTFKGNNFMKTLLAAFILFTVLGMYTGGVGYLLFGESRHFGPDNTSVEFRDSMRFLFKEVIPFLFWFVLPLYLLVVSYFKLKERQV